MSKKCFKKFVCICLIMVFILSNFPNNIFKGSESALVFAEAEIPLAIKYENFAKTDLIQLNGNSLIGEYNGNQVLRLNEAKVNQKSSVFTKNRIYLKNNNSFSTYFVFRSSSPYNPWLSGVHGGDGFTFTIQEVGCSAIGTNSFRFMADGMDPSVSIEFDTYKNDRAGSNDTNDNHVGIDLDGSAESIAQTAFPDTIVNGSEYHVWVDYDGTAQTMEIRVSQDSDTRPASATLSKTNLDLATHFNSNVVYAGFTAATGEPYQQNDILKWYFNNEYQPIDVNNNIYMEASLLSVTADPVSNASTSTITATVTDAVYSSVASVPVEFITDFGTLSEAVVTTDDNGEAATTISATMNGDANIKAVADGGAYQEVTVGLQAMNDADIVAADEAALTFEVIRGGNSGADNINENLNLPITGANGSGIAWSSNNESVIAKDGTVTRPPDAQGDTEVTLTATLTSGDIIATKEFVLTVKCLAQDDAAIVAADEAALTFEVIQNGNSGADNIIENLNLPITGANGSGIAWSSNNESVIAKDGTVTRTPNVQGDADVTLTATLTSGDITATKEFVLTVKCLAQDDTTIEDDAKAVAADKAALVDMVILGENSDIDHITKNLTLPVNGSNGSTIKWSSAQESSIKPFGVVTRPLHDEGDAVVTLTAEIAKGSDVANKTFTLTVKCLTEEETVQADKMLLTTQNFLSDNKSPYYIINNLSLSSTGKHGAQITWKSNNSEVITNDGLVRRPDSTGYTEVMMTASITKNSVSATKVFKLIVISLPDTKGPKILSTVPAKGETGALFDSNIEITFDEAVKKSSNFKYITFGYFKTERYMLFSTRTVFKHQGFSAYIDTTNENKLVIVPSAKMLWGTKYKVIIPKGSIKDRCNNIFESTYTYEFTVEPKELIPPSIKSVFPSENSKNVPLDTPISIVFSEPIREGLSYNDIRLQGYGGNITKTIDGNTLSITLDSNLKNKTDYEIYLPLTAIKDRHGNTLHSPWKWYNSHRYRFTTEPEQIPPKVISTYPEDNTTNINVTQSVSLTFSENIFSSVDYDKIKLTDPEGNVIGATKSIIKRELILKPSAVLNPNTTYTVIIPSAAVKDAAGNNFAEEYTLSYNTGSNLVNFTTVDPGEGERNVAINGIVEFGFEKAVAKGPNFGKIRFANEYGTPVVFNSTLQNNSLIITPAKNRASGLKYSIYLPKGAVIDQDNKQNDEYTSYFITSSPLKIDWRTDIKVNPYGKQIVNKPVELDASELDDFFAEHDRSIIEYYWEYGDGCAETGGSKVSHTYQEVGDYTVRLTVIDSKGFTAQKEQRVWIKPAPETVSFSVSPEGLSRKVEMEANPRSWYMGSRSVKHTAILSCEGIPQANERVEEKLFFQGKEISSRAQHTNINGETTFETFIDGLQPGNYNLVFTFSGKRIDRKLTIEPKRDNIKLKIWLKDRNNNSTVNVGSKIRTEVNGERVYAPKQGDGSYLLSDLSTGYNSIEVYPSYYYSESKRLNLMQQEETVVFEVERNIPSAKPVLRRIGSEFSSTWNYKDRIFIHGVNVDATFDAWVDWKGHEPGYVKFITPKGTFNERDGSKKFNMGKDIGPGGRITAVAVSADGSMSSAVDAKIEVAPKPPLGQARFVDGKYEMDVLYDIKDAVTPGVPDDFPLLGGNVTGLKGDNYKFTGTINDNGEINLYLGLTKAQKKEMSRNNAIKLLDGYKKLKQKKSVSIGGVDIYGSVSGTLQWRYKIQENKWAFTKGVIEADVDGKATKRKYFLIPVVSIPGYVKGTVELDSDTTIKIKEDIQHNDYDYNVILVLDPSLEAAIGAGVEGLSVEGYMKGKLETEIRKPEDQYKVYAILSGGVRAQALIFEWEKEALKYEWQLKDTISVPSRSLLAEPNMLIPSRISTLKSEDFNMMSRDYVGEKSAWLPEEKAPVLLKEPVLAAEYSPESTEPQEPEETREDKIEEKVQERINTQIMQSNVYPYSNQQLVNNGDEMVMVWLDDNLERTSANRTQLKFATFDGKNWSQPQFVNDDGTGDFEPAIAKTSEGVLMAWQNINCVFDDEVTLNEYVSASEISVTQSVYSSVSAWENTVTLTNDAYYDHSPSLAADQDGGVLVWVKNKANDLLGANPGSNDIMFSKWDGTSWSNPVAIVTNEDTIINSSVAYKDKKGVYTYTVDTDHDTQTTTDREIYVLTYNEGQWSNPIQITDNNVEDSNPSPRYLNNGFIMTWYQDGSIVYVNDLQQEQPEVVESIQTAQVDYETAVSRKGQLSLVFAEVSETGGRDIHTLIYDAENDIWSNKIRLTDDSSFDRSYSPAFTEYGKLMLAYSKVELIQEIIDGEEYVNTGSADLNMVTLTPQHDLAVYADNISLSQQNPVPGSTVTVTASINNEGEFVEKNFAVEFYDGDPLAGGSKIGETQLVQQPLSARRAVDVAVDWVVPDDMSAHTLYVIVDPENSIYDIDTHNNTASVVVVQPDIEVTALDSQYVGTTKYLVTARVANIGSIPVNDGEISLFVGDTEGKMLDSKETGVLAPADERVVEFMLDSTDMNFDEGDIDIVAQFTAQQGTEEFDLDNNLCYSTIERTPLVVEKFEPGMDTQKVPVNSQITIGFNMELTQNTDFAEIVLFDSDNNSVAVTKEIQGTNILLTPASALEYSKQYFVYIPVKAVIGPQQNKLPEDYRGSFTTEELLTNPVVRFTYPGDLMAETPVDTSINIGFNEAVAKGGSFNNISLQDSNGKEILSTVGINDQTLMVKPVSHLEDSTEYTLTLPINAVKNNRGNGIEEDFVLKFSTKADSEDSGDNEDTGESGDTGDTNESSNNTRKNKSDTVSSVDKGILRLSTQELLTKLEAGTENIEIMVQNNQEASQLGLIMGKADVDKLVASNKGLTVNMGTMSILFSNKTLGQIAKEMGKEVTIAVEKGQDQNIAFSSYFGQSIEPVYNITIDSGNEVTQRFAEQVKVSLDVDISKIQDSRKVIACVFDEEINEWKAVGGALDLQTGKLNFHTGHFSKYSVFETDQEFADLSNRPSKEQVEILASRGIVFGRGDNRFDPVAVITRAEFTSMVMRIINTRKSVKTGTYSDVPAGAWYTKEIETASELGLVYGTGNSLFQPNRKITREELATIVCRIYAYQKGLVLSNEQGELFDDYDDISPYAKQSVNFLSAKGIVCGSNHKFYPKREATREEAAVILYRLLACLGEIQN